MARIIRPEERNLAPKASARRRPWVSLPDMGKPKMLIEPVSSQVLIVEILSSMALLYHNKMREGVRMSEDFELETA